MPKAKVESVIELKCHLCPKEPDFSDVSHLLTHISSKSHLAHRFNLQIRSQNQAECKVTLEKFENWYQRNNLDSLLSDRMAAKAQKTKAKKSRASNASTASMLSVSPLQIHTCWLLTVPRPRRRRNRRRRSELHQSPRKKCWHIPLSIERLFPACTNGMEPMMLHILHLYPLLTKSAELYMLHHRLDVKSQASLVQRLQLTGKLIQSMLALQLFLAQLTISIGLLLLGCQILRIPNTPRRRRQERS